MNRFEQIIGYAIPLVAVALSFIFGRLSASHTLKVEQLKRRYHGFYVPYITKMYAGFVWEIKQSEMGLESRSAFFDLIMQNIELLGLDTQRYVPNIYDAFLDMLEFENENTNFSDAPQKYDAVMHIFNLAVVKESKELSKKLKMPNISQSLEQLLR